MKSVSYEEQDTTINLNRIDGTAHIYTADTSMIYKFDKLCEQSPDWKCVYADDYGKKYECPKTFITYKLKKRVLSEEAKANAAARLAKFRERATMESESDEL